MKIILISGLPASGKTTSAQYISKKTNASIINVGDALKEYLISKNIYAFDRADIGDLFLKRFTVEDIFMVLEDYLRKDDLFVFDGIRFDTTVNQFLAKYKYTSVLYINANSKIRNMRFHYRYKFFEDPNSIQQKFIKYNSFNSSVLKIQSVSDVLINNDNDFTTLCKNIDEFLKAILI
jgi:dephospho-CoA kinase